MTPRPYITVNGKRDKLPTKTCPLNLAIEESIYKKLVEEAEQDQRTVASLVRKIFTKYYAKKKMTS